MSMKKPTKVELSKAQKSCLIAYRAARRIVGMNPTIDEVGEQMGRSRFTAANHLKSLARKGVLTQNGQKARCYGLPKRQATA